MRTHHLLNVLQQVVKSDEGELGLEMTELAQVAARVTLLGAKALLDAKDVAETRKARLEVELGALREVRLLAVVVEREERRAALDLRLNHARWRDLEQAELLVRLPERRQECRANFENVGCNLSAEDEVTCVGELTCVF